MLKSPPVAIVELIVGVDEVLEVLLKVCVVIEVLLDRLLEPELVVQINFVIRIAALGLNVCSPVNRSYG